MDVGDHEERYFKEVAEHVLATLSEAADAARQKAGSPPGLTEEALATVNGFTGEQTRARIGELNRQSRQAAEQIMREPAVARVVYENVDGQQHTLYFCRAAQSMSSHVWSLLAPMGRLASLEPGDEFTTPRGENVVLLERVALGPKRSPDGWDSAFQPIETETYGRRTVVSARALLALAEEDVDDPLAEIEAAGDRARVILEGTRREVLRGIELRDQPILDRFQDEISRLPIDARLMILGQPGTGKTTTLIRRLGQKLQPVVLEDDERELIEGVGASAGLPHEANWIMFTPTSLLKHYLKEAFARESVPASEARVTTWSDFRHDLARSGFGLLRTASQSRGFRLNDGFRAFTAEAEAVLVEVFEDFDAWQLQSFVEGLVKAARSLSASDTEEISSTADGLIGRLSSVEQRDVASVLQLLEGSARGLSEHARTLRAEVRDQIRAWVRRWLREDPTLAERLAEMLNEIALGDGEGEADGEDSEIDEDADADVQEASSGARFTKQIAVEALQAAIRRLALSTHRRSKIGEQSRARAILDWLDLELPSDQELRSVGAKLDEATSATRLSAPAVRFVRGLPQRYRAFRRARLSEGRWYADVKAAPSELSPTELDLLLLTLLSFADLLSGRRARLNSGEDAANVVDALRSRRRLQVVVDEATDFSPVQIACMAKLTEPRGRSIFACGDFAQRLTTWGTRTEREFTWAIPDIDFRTVENPYRQSVALQQFCRSLLGEAGQQQGAASQVGEGVPPAVLVHADPTKAARWLADRIAEIDRSLGFLPSTAVLVRSDEDAQTIAEALGAELRDLNLRAIACVGGESIGAEGAVRVFDIQHVKGLEFEAVFFANVDGIADANPELFDRYLYVGATRAATYLGLTSSRELPRSLQPHVSSFVHDWSGSSSDAHVG